MTRLEMASFLNAALRTPCTRWSSSPHPRRLVVQPLPFAFPPSSPRPSSSLRCLPNASLNHSHALSESHPIEAPFPAATYLKKISIQDFILVKKQEVHFDPGFNVITGESGGGKSMLIEALNQLLGKTSVGNCVRRSCDATTVEGTIALGPNGVRRVRSLFRQSDFENRILSDGEFEKGGELVIRREIFRTKTGQRSRCYVNGVATSVKFLKALSELFFDVNGQHSITQLGNKQRQLALIDQIAGQSELKREISKIYKRMNELRSLVSTREMKRQLDQKSPKLMSIDASNQNFILQDGYRCMYGLWHPHPESSCLYGLCACKLEKDNAWCCLAVEPKQ